MIASNASSSFTESWQLLYRARSLFAGLLILAMVLNVAAMLAVSVGHVIDQPQPTVAPTTAATVDPAPAEPNHAPVWAAVIRIVMAVTAVLATVAAIFMLFSALVGLMILIAGGMPGTAPVTSSFFWALLAVVLLTWAPLLSHVVADMTVIGTATFENLETTYKLTLGEYATFSTHIPLWIGFCAYPIIIILIAVMYLGRTAQANAQITADKEPEPDLASRLAPPASSV